MKLEKPDLAFRDKLSPLKKVDKIICHHPAHPTWDINDIHKYHRDSKGWSGIGYNYFVTFDGRIQEGRGRNQGAHTLGGWNYKSLGVSFQGNFEIQEMTDEQVSSGTELIASLIRSEGLGINDVVGHRDLWATACPGKNFRMADLKSAILVELNPATKKESVKMLLIRGDRSEDVKKLQENLNTLGYDAESADGIFGPGTERAVKSFQRASGLTVDGIAGSQTLAKMQTILNANKPAAPKKESVIVTLGGRKYKIEEL